MVNASLFVVEWGAQFNMQASGALLKGESVKAGGRYLHRDRSGSV